MYKSGKYRETDKMSDLICENYPMVLVMNRFGIDLGFGEKNIGEVCRQNGVDATTFLTVVNFLTQETHTGATPIDRSLSIETLITYLHNAHDYFLNFRLPKMRHKLLEAIAECPQDVAFVIQRFFDEYAEEVNKHMSYEEEVVFPYVRGLLAGIKDPKYNIAIFQKKHDQVEMKIVELKNILIKYYPGEGSHLLNSVLFDIFATEQDLVSHSHVEDYLFLPAIIALERELNGETTPSVINKREEDEGEEQQTLSAREKEIIVCVVKGMTNKEIADRLFLSTHTVITHRKNIARKLQVHNASALTVYAIVNKLVELRDIQMAR